MQTPCQLLARPSWGAAAGQNRRDFAHRMLEKNENGSWLLNKRAPIAQGESVSRGLG